MRARVFLEPDVPLPSIVLHDLAARHDQRNDGEVFLVVDQAEQQGHGERY